MAKKKPKTKGPSQVSIVAKVILAGKPFTLKQLVAKIAKAFPKSSEDAIKTGVYYLLNFARHLKVIERTDQGAYRPTDG